jgi:hypothetical protein
MLYSKLPLDELQNIYGAVTTGISWQFLSLEEQIVKIDLAEYYLQTLPLILGILPIFIPTAKIY